MNCFTLPISAQKLYGNNLKRLVKQTYLTDEVKEKIIHYIEQKYSPEMMVKTKKVQYPSLNHLLLDSPRTLGFDSSRYAVSSQKQSGEKES